MGICHNKNAFVYTNAYLAKDIAYIILQKEGGYMSSDKRDITKLIRFNDREYQIVKEHEFLSLCQICDFKHKDAKS